MQIFVKTLTGKSLCVVVDGFDWVVSVFGAEKWTRMERASNTSRLCCLV